MANLKKHRYIKLFTFTDLGLSHVKTLCLTPEISKTIEIVLAKGSKQLVATS